MGIRFYDAVVKGCERTIQVFRWRPLEAPTEACVLKAAAIGAGLAVTRYVGDTPTTNYSDLYSRFPFLSGRISGCFIKGCRCEVMNYLDLCFHLNDDHRWTREQIALYVSQYEPQEEAEEERPESQPDSPPEGIPCDEWLEAMADWPEVKS